MELNGEKSIFPEISKIKTSLYKARAIFLLFNLHMEASDIYVSKFWYLNIQYLISFISQISYKIIWLLSSIIIILFSSYLVKHFTLILILLSNL